MDNNLLTVSLGAWMELPNLTMSEWKDVGTYYGKRITASLVAEYYQDYIKKMVLEEYFSNDTVVTSVKKVKVITQRDCKRVCEKKSKKTPPAKFTSQLAQIPSIDILEMDNKNLDEANNDELQHESIFFQELEEEGPARFRARESCDSTSDSSTISDCSDTILADVQISPPLSLARSEKNSSPFSRSSTTSGYGASISSSELGSSVRSNQPKFDRSISMFEETSRPSRNIKDALSATRVGRLNT